MKTPFKKCSKCGRILPRSEYYVRSNGQNLAACKECTREAAKERERIKREEKRAQDATGEKPNDCMCT